MPSVRLHGSSDAARLSDRARHQVGEFHSGRSVGAPLPKGEGLAGAYPRWQPWCQPSLQGSCEQGTDGHSKPCGEPAGSRLDGPPSTSAAELREDATRWILFLLPPCLPSPRPMSALSHCPQDSPCCLSCPSLSPQCPLLHVHGLRQTGETRALPGCHSGKEWVWAGFPTLPLLVTWAPMPTQSAHTRNYLPPDLPPPGPASLLPFPWVGLPEMPTSPPGLCPCCSSSFVPKPARPFLPSALPRPACACCTNSMLTQASARLRSLSPGGHGQPLAGVWCSRGNCTESPSCDPALTLPTLPRSLGGGGLQHHLGAESGAKF